MHRRFLSLMLLHTVVLALILAGAQPALAEPAKISPELRSQVQLGQAREFMVVLTERADLSAAEALGTKAEKGQYVFETLRETAHRTQAPLIGWLKARGYRVQSFFIDNQLLVESPDGQAVRAPDLDDLAALPSVARVEPLRPAWVEDELPRRAVELPESRGSVTFNPNIVSVGVVPWHETGIRGQGVVVGISDSGASASHPALAANYRGAGGAGHNYNWFDPTPAASPTPVDTNGHGTHVTGVAVGSTGSNVIGVAPGAQWIACRGVGPGSSQATVLACLQWFLAPTQVNGQNPDPSRAPDVTNHSYICPFCGLQVAFANLRSAGIASVTVSSNQGPTCGSIFDPGTYPGVLTIGATDLEGGRDAALGEYSGRGPLDDNEVRPHLVAPGTAVVSAEPGDGYGERTGTSHASPHVAGMIALLWSARPHLVGSVAATENLLFSFAYPRLNNDATCPSPTSIPNNLYGWGFLQMPMTIFANGFEQD